MGAELSVDTAVQLLTAADSFHRAFEGCRIEGLCSLADRLYMFSPAVARAEREGIDLYPKMLGLGWERFAEVVPRELGAVIVRLVEDPSPLVRELEKGPLTLIHGDYKLGNVGIAHDGRIVAIDWALACAAPPEIELVWVLGKLDEAQARDEVVAAWRRIRGDAFDPSRLRLALLFEVLIDGGDWARLSHWSSNPTRRAQNAVDLEWWLKCAAEALESWTPQWGEPPTE